MIEMFDILEDNYWKKQVLDSIPNIVSSGHHNAQNYLKLPSRLENYECFNVVANTETNELLAISGLYHDELWPDNIARVVDRTYYYNWKTSHSPYKPKHRYNANYFIPHQAKLAKNLGYEIVMITVQNPEKTIGLKLITSWTEPKFTMLEGLYQTCKSGPLCWQNTAIHKFKPDAKFSLPYMSKEEWYDRYKDFTGIR
jgi:hypothetical protein